MIATKIVIKKNKLTKVSVENLKDIAFVLYFSSRMVSTVILEVLQILNVTVLEDFLTVLVVYAPLALYLFVSLKKALPLDFFFLFSCIIALFAGTLLLHPEYEYWYSRDNYGVWDYVFFPAEAIYAYLFIRMMDSPARLTRNMKISGWIMYVYFVIQILFSLRRGYWYGVGAESGSIKSSYSVSFGYNVLLYALVFSYDAIVYKKTSDIAASAIGLFMILSYGSRGPVLFIGVFLAFIALTHFKDSKKKWIVLLVVLPLIIFFYLFYDVIVMLLLNLLSSLNISSRFITKILDGTVADDNGRMEIWLAAINMIKENPLGYGAMGSQHVISNYNFAGYPHSVILEILIDFGVIFGTFILVFLFGNALAMLFSKKNVEWRGVFIVFFSSACCLLISLCYWSAHAFWASIAVGVNCYMDKKRKRRMRINDTNRSMM